MCRERPRAVVDDVRAGVDAERLQGAEHAGGAAGEGAVAADGEPDVVGEHLGRLVVADVEEPLDELADRGALDARELGRRRVRRRPVGSPTTFMPAFFRALANVAAAVNDGSSLRP